MLKATVCSALTVSRARVSFRLGLRKARALNTISGRVSAAAAAHRAQLSAASSSASAGSVDGGVASGALELHEKVTKDVVETRCKIILSQFTKCCRICTCFRFLKWSTMMMKVVTTPQQHPPQQRLLKAWKRGPRGQVGWNALIFVLPGCFPFYVGTARF